METRPYSLAVGLFVLALLAGVLAFILWFSRFEMGDDRRTYMIHFKGSVSGLRVNETVRFHGIPIGTVKKIFVDPHAITAVKVKVHIDKPELIREDSLASIEAQGLTGFSFIQIVGGSPESPVLRAKSEQKHPVIRSRPSSIEVLFTSVPEILEKIRDLSGHLNHLFNGKNIHEMEKTFENIAKITKKYADKDLDLETLIAKAEKTFEKASYTMSKADEVFVSFKETSEFLKKMMENNAKPLQQFTHHGLNDMTHLAQDLRQAMSQLYQVLDQIEKSPLQFLRKDPSTGVEIP